MSDKIRKRGDAQASSNQDNGLHQDLANFEACDLVQSYTGVEDKAYALRALRRVNNDVIAACLQTFRKETDLKQDYDTKLNYLLQVPAHDSKHTGPGTSYKVPDNHDVKAHVRSVQRILGKEWSLRDELMLSLKREQELKAQVQNLMERSGLKLEKTLVVPPAGVRLELLEDDQDEFEEYYPEEVLETRTEVEVDDEE